MEKDQRPSAALLGLVNGFWVCRSVWEYTHAIRKRVQSLIAREDEQATAILRTCRRA